KFPQPFRLDHGRECQQYLSLAVARFDLAEFGSDEEPCAMHHTLSREQAAPVAHQRAAQRSLIEPRRDLIGKTRQHATRDRARHCFAFAGVEPFRARDAEKLLPKLGGLARRARFYSQPRATARVEIILFRKTKCPDENEEIG